MEAAAEKSSTPAVVPGAAPALAKAGVGGYVLISFGSWSAKMVRWKLPWVLAARSYSLTTFQLHVIGVHFPSNPNNCMWPDDGTLMVLLVQYSFQHHCDSSPGFER